jgi:uracil-DNA glycosylase family 4
MALHPQAKALWKELRNPNCELCPLHEDAQVVCLMGDGPVPAKIMFVGEAPGFREDEVSRPFSGAAGQLLDRSLERAGIRREDVYITNSCRCRPADNRTPTRTEIKACRVYMEAEIQKVQPSVIVAMGNVALQSLLNTSGVMKKRGTSLTKDGQTYFITVHPAAVLRNPALQSEFDNDMVALSRLVKGENATPITKSYLVSTEKSLKILLEKIARVSTPIAFDVETRNPHRREGGLEPWGPGGIIDCAAFCWEPGTAYVVALEHPDAGWKIPVPRVYQALGVALERKRLVGHNVKFDLQWFRAKGLTSLRASFDTLLAAHLLDENRSNRLKSLARTYLGADMYESGISFTEEAADLRTLAIYNGKDADYTLQLYHIFKAELIKQPKLLRLFKLLTMPACNALTDIELRGFPVDYERLKSRHAELNLNIQTLEDEIIERWVPEHLSGARPNFRSPLFLSAWLFGERSLRLPIIEVSPKSNRPSTREGVLLQLRDKHPAIDGLMELRKLYKYESTYTRNWLQRVAIVRKPRLYPSYNIAGTVTGRLSSNMQQVPRDTYIRSIIGTRPGWKLIEADFSQAELRIAAMLSNDRELVYAFTHAKDPHLEMAAAVTGLSPSEVTKEQRKMAKAVNFGFLYGMGWKKFKIYADEKYGVKVSDSEAKAAREAFFRKYAGLPRWHARQRRLVTERGFVRSPIGRVRHLPSISSSDDGMVAEAERQAINSPVQGLASDFTVLSMVLLHERLDPRNARVLGNLHDAVMLEARDEVAGEVAEIVRETMESLPLARYFGFKPSVPIKVDVAVKQHWGE